MKKVLLGMMFVFLLAACGAPAQGDASDDGAEVPAGDAAQDPKDAEDTGEGVPSADEELIARIREEIPDYATMMDDDPESMVYSVWGTLYTFYGEVFAQVSGEVVKIKSGEDGMISCWVHPYSEEGPDDDNELIVEEVPYPGDKVIMETLSAKLRLLDKLEASLPPKKWILDTVADDFDGDGSYEMFAVVWDVSAYADPDEEFEHMYNEFDHCTVWYTNGEQVTEMSYLKEYDEWGYRGWMRKGGLSDGRTLVYISYGESRLNDYEIFFMVDKDEPYYVGSLTNGYIRDGKIYSGTWNVTGLDGLEQQGEVKEYQLVNRKLEEVAQ